MKYGGLDFGTTNSSLSINSGNTVRLVALDQEAANAEVLRSVLFFEQGGAIYSGQGAINRYVDDVSSGRFMRSLKSLLTSEIFVGTTIGGRYYDATALVATFLAKLHERIEALEGELEHVVIGRPVVFSENPVIDKLAETRLLEAAKKAGFKSVSLQYEPIAAALMFEASLAENESRVVLVGDFGGGTTDFTVMRVGAHRSRHRTEDILALGGVYIGGDSFDSAMMWERVGARLGKGARYRNSSDRWREMPDSIVRLLKSWHTIPFLRERRIREKILNIMDTTDDRQALENLDRLVEDNTGIALFQSIEVAKCQLSAADFGLVAFDGLKHPIRETIVRQEFETLLAPSLEQIDTCLSDVIRMSGLPADRIVNVFLAGGTSQIPCVREVFLRRFGEGKMSSQDAFTSVAFGLGVSAGASF